MGKRCYTNKQFIYLYTIAVNFYWNLHAIPTPGHGIMKRTTCLFKQIIPVVKMLLFSFHPTFVFCPFPSRFIIKTMLKQASQHSLIKVRHFKTKFPISLTWNFCFTLDSLYVSSARRMETTTTNSRCLGLNSVKTGKLLNHAVPLVYVICLFVSGPSQTMSRTIAVLARVFRLSAAVALSVWPILVQ